MWRTQRHQLPYFCKCKLRSKWAGWYGRSCSEFVPCTAFHSWNSNEWDACRLCTQGPAGLGKSESGFRGLFCAAAWMLIIWFFLLVDMLVQPSLRWRTDCRWAKVRNNYCLRNYTCGLAFLQLAVRNASCSLSPWHGTRMEQKKWWHLKGIWFLSRFNVNCVC